MLPINTIKNITFLGLDIDQDVGGPHRGNHATLELQGKQLSSLRGHFFGKSNRIVDGLGLVLDLYIIGDTLYFR